MRRPRGDSSGVGVGGGRWRGGGGDDVARPQQVSALGCVASASSTYCSVGRSGPTPRPLRARGGVGFRGGGRSASPQPSAVRPASPARRQRSGPACPALLGAQRAVGNRSLDSIGLA